MFHIWTCVWIPKAVFFFIPKIFIWFVLYHFIYNCITICKKWSLYCPTKESCVFTETRKGIIATLLVFWLSLFLFYFSGCTDINRNNFWSIYLIRVYCVLGKWINAEVFFLLITLSTFKEEWKSYVIWKAEKHSLRPIIGHLYKYIHKRIYACVFCMHYHTNNLLAMKFWEVVQYTTEKISDM